MSPASWSLPNASWKTAPESTSKLCIYFLTLGEGGGQEVSFMLQSLLLDPVSPHDTEAKLTTWLAPKAPKAQAPKSPPDLTKTATPKPRPSRPKPRPDLSPSPDPSHRITSHITSHRIASHHLSPHTSHPIASHHLTHHIAYTHHHRIASPHTSHHLTPHTSHITSHTSHRIHTSTSHQITHHLIASQYLTSHKLCQKSKRNLCQYTLGHISYARKVKELYASDEPHLTSTHTSSHRNTLHHISYARKVDEIYASVP